MTDPTALQTLPSGRTVAVGLVGGEEQLVVRSPDGAVEVQVVLTAAGAVVRVGAARLEVAAAEVAVDCRSLAISAADGVSVTAGEFRVKTDKSIHLNGETVRLNCTDPTSPAGLP
ncbi:MAG: hypothetical protein U0871_19480 [Gemmataceae bacterium]